MTLKFTKMHGLGNDFMVIDAINQPFVARNEQLKEWSKRKTGIGFDQLLLVEKPTLSAAEFKYRIFNADGSEVEQCGNGARCFARFVREKGLTNNHVISVETAAGLITLEMMSETDVRVNMGAPILIAKDIPLDESQICEDSYHYELTFDDLTIQFSAVSMGNPHAVIRVNDIESVPVEIWGPLLQSHSFFPQGVNVGFMQIVNKDIIKLRVFERGVGETQACGMGACAAMVAGHLAGELNDKVTVQLLGGSLEIEWQGEQSVVMMTGATASVFEGKIE